MEVDRDGGRREHGWGRKFGVWWLFPFLPKLPLDRKEPAWAVMIPTEPFVLVMTARGLGDSHIIVPGSAELGWEFHNNMLYYIVCQFIAE